MAVPPSTPTSGVGPSICVALSVRNGERYLGEAIDSVLSQQGVQLELRLYDNGSTDGSLALCRAYEAADARVIVTENGDGLGYFDSLNIALTETDCRYFAPFACDDLMYPGNLAAKVALLEQTGAGLAHSRAALIDESGARIALSVCFDDVPEYLPAPQFLLRTAPMNTLSCQSTVIRTSAFRWLGGFDPSAWYCGDWLAWMQLALRVGVVTVREPLVANRVHGESGTSGAQRSGAFAPHCMSALERVLDDELFPGAWADLRPQFRARLLLHLATELQRYGHLLAGDGPGAYTYAARARAYAEARPAAESLHRQLLENANLSEPVFPFAAVARAPQDATAAVRFVDELAGLSAEGLLQELALVTAPGTLDSAVATLGPLVERLAFDVDLIEGELESCLVPGRVLVAPAGSPDISAAESSGIPALPVDGPLPAAPWPTSVHLDEVAA